MNIQDKLVSIASALSSERCVERLLEQILSSAVTFSNAEAGSLYIVDDEDQYLEFLVVFNEALGISLAGKQQVERAGLFAKIPLYLHDNSPNFGTLATYCAHGERIINVPNAYEENIYDFSGVKNFDKQTGYHSQSFLSARMEHGGRTVGVLQLINARNSDKHIVPFSSDLESLLAALASMAAIAYTNRRLLQQQEELFESLIRMINNALYAKSRHTGGHCQRVPELTMMLAHKVVQDTSFSTSNDLDSVNLYALRIAGLLHDCGKLVTPPHIIEKSRKLEGICDRLEQVYLRMELARKDWLLVADSIEARTAVHTRVNSDKDFLGKMNYGVERVSEEDLARVRDIAAQYHWVDASGQLQPCILTDELAALTIRAGTLTDAEREEIKSHIVHTINMLESIPWPRHLRDVPALAGGHHERVDGKGYPRGLRGEQMPVGARIMAIADVFESLTAADRPYKQPMSLSQALGIMDRFAENGHLDPALYRIFKVNKVYLDYAQHFLMPSQIDCD